MSIIILFIYCSYTVHTLFIYCSYTVHILFIHCSYTVHILFIHCSYTVHTLFIYCSYTVHILFISCSYTVHILPERPDPPINVTVTSYDKRTVDLSWQPDFDGNRDILGYQVYRKDYDDMSDQFSLVSPTYLTTTETSFTVSSGIIPYTKYVFKVLACNVIGCTDISDATPSDPIRTPPDGNFVKLCCLN